MVYSLPVHIEKNPDHSINLICHRLRLHSKNPREEARRFCESLQAESGAALVAGIGWGYIVEELTSSKSNLKPLFFLEPIAEIYRLLKSHGRLSELKRLGFTIYSSIGELRGALQKAGLLSPALQLIVIPAYQRLLPDLKLSVGRELQLQSSKSRPAQWKNSEDQLNQRTAAHFLRQWSRNILRRLKTDPPELSFLGPQLKFVGRRPEVALYCGGGPQLLEELQKLPVDLLNNSFVMAVDTALAALLQSGMPVDLALSVDSGRGTFFHLAALEKILAQPAQKMAAGSFDGAQRAPFPVLTWSAGVGHLDRWFSEVYYYRSTLPFDQLLAEGPLAHCPQWKNSSRNPLGLAILMAELLNCPTLYLAGVSFQKRAGKSHVRGSGYTFYGLTSVDRTFSLEMYQPGYNSAIGSRDRITLWNAHRMAESRKIELKKIGETREIEETREMGEARANTSHTTGRWQMQGFLPFNREDLRRYLQDIWQHLNYETLEHWGLTKNTTRRFKILLTDR